MHAGPNDHVVVRGLVVAGSAMALVPRLPWHTPGPTWAYAPWPALTVPARSVSPYCDPPRPAPPGN
ncbi:hypothetical protein [Streptomyces virginiae]|uniref:hypothetical protein n=1 Tax=Streptomyces virginiae TaxID=1961 RepID=UPI0036FEE117